MRDFKLDFQTSLKRFEKVAASMQSSDFISKFNFLLELFVDQHLCLICLKIRSSKKISYPVLKICFILYCTVLFIMDKLVLTNIEYKVYSSTYLTSWLFKVNTFKQVILFINLMYNLKKIFSVSNKQVFLKKIFLLINI